MGKSKDWASSEGSARARKITAEVAGREALAKKAEVSKDKVKLSTVNRELTKDIKHVPRADSN